MMGGEREVLRDFENAFTEATVALRSELAAYGQAIGQGLLDLEMSGMYCKMLGAYRSGELRLGKLEIKLGLELKRRLGRPSIGVLDTMAITLDDVTDIARYREGINDWPPNDPDTYKRRKR